MNLPLVHNTLCSSTMAADAHRRQSVPCHHTLVRIPVENRRTADEIPVSATWLHRLSAPMFRSAVPT